MLFFASTNQVEFFLTTFRGALRKVGVQCEVEPDSGLLNALEEKVNEALPLAKDEDDDEDDDGGD